jgi:imidazolonepropionase-like amidohydrolase
MRLTVKYLLLCGVLMGLFVPLSIGQTTFPQNGVYDEREGLYAFTNATIQKSWNEKIENATLLVRNGRIEAVGTGIVVPKDAVVFDLKGRYIYPSFIDPFSNYGMPEIAPTTQRGRAESQQPLSNKRGAYSWNEAMKTEFKAGEIFVTNEKDADILRGAGFGAVLTHRFDGISRGSGSVVLATNDREHTAILKPVAAHILSFSKGTSTQPYPQSLMGGIALLRQTYLDGNWYATTGVKEERNFSLEAWNSLQSVPQIFAVGDRLEALRAVKIGAEFNKKYIIKGAGDEYQRLDAIKATGSSFILPLAFPETYDVEDPIDAQQVNLADLKHWELAPTNPARLAAAGIEFSLTANGLRAKSDFLKQVQKAIEAGLSEGDALKAMTATPAKMMGVEADLGSLEKGKIANFIVTSAPIFQKDAKIFHNWVAGKGYVLSNDMDKPNLQGTYNFDLIGVKSYYKMEITDKNDATIFVSDSIKFKAEIKQERSNVVMTFTPSGEKDLVRVFGTYEGGVFKGKAQMGDGSFADWQSAPMSFSGKTTGKAPEKTDKSDKNTSREGGTGSSVKTTLGDVVYPFMAFGNKDLPMAKTVIFKNATVWTNEADGILKKSDVIISNGKIMFIGENLTAPKDATIVDATGKHLTAGIIDEHSHIAMSRGTNEGTQSCTSEVRVGDIINSDDINIYRQLAGGVTSSHILHGSANAIGGQTQLIKLRWGMEPEKMKFENWQGYIKFALGENVKQSNWEIADNQRIRFPQTRMGVEQVYEDHFTRAKEYLALKNAGKPYRRDLELDALGEILEGKRHITCHSYVQSEITMLIRAADRYGFKVNTFTHILEGYKVADKMAKHGAAGAGFADWWAYKMEVYEAIPQGAKMMQDAGVLSSINSDDAEMARRLNQEAAKTIMYSGNDEVSAWKMVTLNPAKTLRVGERVGSIKVGKDADVVLWSDNPLSIYAKAEQTYVDGVKYFDRADDVKAQAEVRKERARLIQKLLASKKGGATTQPATGRPQRLWDCEDVRDEMKD